MPNEEPSQLRRRKTENIGPRNAPQPEDNTGKDSINASEAERAAAAKARIERLPASIRHMFEAKKDAWIKHGIIDKDLNIIPRKEKA